MRAIKWIVLVALTAVITTVIAFVVNDKLKDATKPKPLRPTTIPRDGSLEPVAGIRILKRETTNKSYVLQGHTARSIADQGTYTCTAPYYPAEFNVPVDVWNRRQDKLGDDATCPSGDQPELSPRLIADHYLLLKHGGPPKDVREAAWEIVHGHRLRVPPQGPLFDCLTRRYLVWDYVTDKEILNFPPMRSQHRPRCR